MSRFDDQIKQLPEDLSDKIKEALSLYFGFEYERINKDNLEISRGKYEELSTITVKPSGKPLVKFEVQTIIASHHFYRQGNIYYNSEIYKGFCTGDLKLIEHE